MSESFLKSDAKLPLDFRRSVNGAMSSCIDNFRRTFFPVETRSLDGDRDVLLVDTSSPGIVSDDFFRNSTSESEMTSGMLTGMLVSSISSRITLISTTGSAVMRDASGFENAAKFMMLLLSAVRCDLSSKPSVNVGSFTKT